MDPITDNSFTEDIRRSKREIAYIEVVHNGFKILPEAYSYDPSRFQFILNNVSARPQDYTVVFKDQLTGEVDAQGAPEVAEAFTERGLKMKSIPMLTQIAGKAGIEVPADAGKAEIIKLILENQG